MSNIDAVNGAVVFDVGLHGGLPVNIAVVGLDLEEVGVFELDEEACALAEVAPHTVPDDLHATAVPRTQGGSFRVQLQHEAVLAVDSLLANARRV